MVNQLVANLVNSVLGHGKSTARGNQAHTCPFCVHAKPKLEINLDENSNHYQKWHCWACGKKSTKLLSLFKAIDAPQEKIAELKSLVGSGFQIVREEQKTDLKLPEGFKSLSEITENDIVPEPKIHSARVKAVVHEEEVIRAGVVQEDQPKAVSTNSAQMSDVVSVVLGEDADGHKLSWNLSLKGSPHGVIVGIPGQGKSVTTRNILNQFAEQGLPSVVFDFHGDMGPKLKFKSNEINVAVEGLPFSPFEFDSGGALPIRTASQ